MIWVAVGLAVAAAVAAWTAHQAREERRRLVGNETLTAAQLRELHAAAGEAAGPDAFREPVELKGRAAAHVDGLLTSELTSTPCVWYRQKVTRKYEEVRRDSDGNRRVEQREEVMTDHHSDKAFFVVDETGRIPVVPDKSVQGARKVLSEFRQAEGGGGSSRLTFGSFSLDLPSGNRGGTLGYEYEEWVLPEGAQLFVCGEAVDRGGRLSVRKPQSGKLVLTTRTEEELVEGAEKRFRWAALGGIAAAVGAVVALVVALAA
ncbi:GIDE domain-containing protein [Nocardioides solisilvae]|uniref:GIDE domain-containing protein n=1 Tax=Nocardioides solisilvae TaxID=1542435 RepID=UPI000D74B3E1|nr:GIDE domain-containing protein [Nocardioides solisilvae]